MSTSIALRRVSMDYGVARILSDCDLVVSAGTDTAVLGRSGSGKSTVLRLLAGLDPPTRGQVRLDETVASEPRRIIVPPHRRQVGMVFQDLGLWPTLTVAENVMLALSPSGRYERTRAMQALRVCRVDGFADRHPGSLSGGEQQRVALARAIAAEPRFLLLDEPFSGLDPCTKQALLAEIAELCAARHMTLVVVTHDPSEALTLCERAIVLADGRVGIDGPWSTVLVDTQTDPLLQAFKTFAAMRAS